MMERFEDAKSRGEAAEGEQPNEAVTRDTTISRPTNFSVKTGVSDYGREVGDPEYDS